MALTSQYNGKSEDPTDRSTLRAKKSKDNQDVETASSESKSGTQITDSKVKLDRQIE